MTKLVVSDLDGTLLTPEKQITPLSMQAVADVLAAGIRFTAISSRPPHGMRWIIEELNLREPFAAFNGAAIVSPDWKLLFANYIEPTVARNVIAAAIAAGASPWVYTDDDWFVQPGGPSAHVEREARTVRFRPTTVESFDHLLDRVIKVQAVSDNPAVIARCEAMIHATARDKVSATRSQTYYYDVTPPGGDKGSGVARLCTQLQIPLAQTTTIGDMENDIPMLMRAGFSIAMGQASSEVKAAAKAVTGSDAAEGFAMAMYRFVLGRELPGQVAPAKSA
jgi:Cof subfamily protein (haloacid dehalogenase superfamily)